MTASSCSVFQAQPVTAVEPWLPLLTPKSLGQNITALQKVTGERGDQQFESLFQLEIDQDHLAMVASTLSGSTLYSLQFKDQALSQSRSPLLPAKLDPKFVLADLQLTFWPVAAIDQALAGSPYQLRQDGLRRSLFMGEQRLVLIQYSNADPFSGQVTFENFVWHYRYQIETLAFEASAVP